MQEIMKAIEDNEIPSFCNDTLKIVKFPHEVELNFKNEKQSCLLLKPHFLIESISPVLKLSVPNNLTFNFLFPEICSKAVFQKKIQVYGQLIRNVFQKKQVDCPQELKSFLCFN
jgi:hypothetical protein